MRKTVLAVAVLIVAPAFAQNQNPTPQFYESGNAFLHSCDDSGVTMQSQSTQVRETASLICTMWVVGVVQGMGLEDQLRPFHEDPAAIREYDQAFAKSLKDAGITSSMTIPSNDVCIPHSSTNEQYKLVTIAYMKEHPTQLNEHAALLVIAAFKTGWPCKEAK
jgi:hypothetical protein